MTCVSATIFQFFSDNHSLILDETVWTLKLFGASFGIALLIAVPLGVWLGHLHRFRFLAINISNVGRSLPSLAVISIGIAIIGLGFKDVMIALVILAVPVILTNAYIAVDAVDRDLVQAARGMGMTGWQMLRQVELPLAIPLLFAGIRTAGLYVMATTPLAAISGARRRAGRHHLESGELQIRGRRDGCARHHGARVRCGGPVRAAAAVAHAARGAPDLRAGARAAHRQLVTGTDAPNGGLVTGIDQDDQGEGMTIRTWQRSMVALLVVAMAIGLAACGSSKKSSTSSSSGGSASGAQPGKGKPAIKLGDKNFTEQYILGQLYAQALQAKGYSVTLKDNIGSSEITDKALKSGQIDMYPEYTGTIDAELAHTPPASRPKSADEAYTKAKAYEEKSGSTLLDKTPFVDADANAVLKGFAQKNNLKTTSDLKKLKSFSFGAPPENKTRFEGVLGMHQAYGLTNLKFVPLAIGLQYQALDSGKIDVGVVFTTDGQLLGNDKYTILTDDKAIYGFQNVAPVVKKKVLAAEGPDFATTLNAVSAKLTDDAIRRMNQAVSVNKQKPADVAKQFLKANGLA